MIRPILLATIIALSQTSAYGQLVRLVIKPKKQLTTRITDCSNIQLFTIDGVIALSEILSVRFIKQAPDSSMINKLTKAGVLIYVGNEKENSQSEISIKEDNREFNAVASLGAGIGLDYGGIGGKFELFPAAPIGLFAGVGNNLAGTGFNAGLDFNFRPYKPSTPILLVMYGYNTVLNDRYIYKGFSIGLGGKLGLGPENKANLAFALMYPIREQGLQNSIRQGFVKAAPILYSLGINFNLGHH
jgi:hypothetical protein